MTPKKRVGPYAHQKNSKAVELANAVNAAMGKGTVIMGNDPYLHVTYLPTEIIPIDELLHGGLPFGRFVEIWGDFSSLKSYIGYKAIASAQKRGLLAALIDTEHSFDPNWAKDIGIDLDELIYKQPETGEKAIDLAEVLIRGGVDIIVFDSVAAALPKSEQQIMLGGDKNVQPARLAQLMSLAMRKLTAANKKTTVLWINQTRVNVGVMFGSNETVPGGKALGFYSSYRISMRKSGKVMEDVSVYVMDKGKPTRKTVKQTVAQTIRATVEKSKLNAPYRDVMFNFDFRNGEIDEWLYLCYKCLDLGLIAYERGMWFEMKGKIPKKYRGRESFQRIYTETVLREMLSPTAQEFLGAAPPDKSKGGLVKPKSSKPKVIKRTPTQVQAESSSTVATTKISSKSKMRTRVIRYKKST